MPRYVVLHHVGHGSPHFDWMLERDADGPLTTFRVRAWPVAGRQALTPLADHRRAYLDYEGEVSGGRGSVRRVEAGTWADAGAGRLRLESHEINGKPARRRLNLVLESDAVRPDGGPSVGS